MRKLDTVEIRHALKDMAQEANYGLTNDVVQRIEACAEKETNPLAKDILEKIQENITIAKEEHIPLCQDTGMACVFLEIGQQVYLEGMDLYQAVNEGIRQGYREGYLRKSIVADPLRRTNTGDNTPANIHVDIVPGDKVKIEFAPKGFGSENMSRLKMFPPSAGVEGVREFVVETVKIAGGNPCPPIVVGVGLGAGFDHVTYLAKKALLRDMDSYNPDPFYKQLEEQMLEDINKLDIGPQGFGGKTTALKVNIIAEPTHIAGMPCAVNINCHVSRHRVRII